MNDRSSSSRLGIRVISHKGTEYEVQSHGLVSAEYKGDRRGAPLQAHVACCREWLSTWAHRPGPICVSSYVLKHTIERHAGLYITNGAAIEAVCQLGWDVLPDSPDSPNARLRLGSGTPPDGTRRPQPRRSTPRPGTRRPGTDSSGRYRERRRDPTAAPAGCQKQHPAGP